MVNCFKTKAIAQLMFISNSWHTMLQLN